ncbi:hypothetical protein Q8A73_014813 [Channa argus]|nr:hypothetical protein Q8A73_014813 [Channa argus]
MLIGAEAFQSREQNSVSTEEMPMFNITESGFSFTYSEHQEEERKGKDIKRGSDKVIVENKVLNVRWDECYTDQHMSEDIASMMVPRNVCGRGRQREQEGLVV